MDFISDSITQAVEQNAQINSVCPPPKKKK